MQTPIIVRVSLEPFCPACGGGLELQEDCRTAHDAVTAVILGFVFLCPGCGQIIGTSDVAWREREKEE